jgi:hypothetical protein
MEKVITLEKSCYVYLKEGGEICNRLGRGTRVWLIKRNGEWAKVRWRNGKKKGWIHNLPESDEI